MKAIILAAGVGERLGEVSGNRPKCLLEFGGISLLHRHLAILDHHDLNNIVVVTGYREDLIKETIRTSGFAAHVQTAHNTEFRLGSLISMLTGLRTPGNGEGVLLMDADVLYDHRIIQRLLDSKHENCFLLDRNFIPGEEPVKLCVRNGQLVEFRKKIDDNLQFDMQGESVGFFRFNEETTRRLIASAEKYLSLEQDRQPYEECIRDLVLETPRKFGFEDVSDLSWIEIDFPEDVTRAEQEILPKIATVL